MDRIDFRSDTVTWPTPEMRAAMAAAPLGDDVYGEDPTVNELEARAADIVGKEAGLLVTSGSMGNLVATLTHADRGDEAIVSVDGHSYLWEAGGMATLGGIVPHPLATDPCGRMDLAEVEGSVRGDDPHLPRSRLIMVENSYGAKNGFPLPPDYFAAVKAIAQRHDLACHLDGARLFNAAVALELPAAELTRHVDSVTFCLSKGLCAPVGSVLCGSGDFIHEARRHRKALGGGMRQAGVLAAAGLISLNTMIDRLAEDHRLARRLAEGLAAIPGLTLDLDRIRTNIVFFDLAADLPLAPDDVIRRLRQDHDVLLGKDGPRTLRAVTHFWLDEKAVDALVAGIGAIVAAP